VVDDRGDFGTRLEQPLPQHLERVLVGDVEGDVVELDGAVGGTPGRLGEGLGPRHLEEGHGVAAAHLEEVVAHGTGHGRRREAHAEHAHVEAHGRVHVGRDEGQVVMPASAARPAGVGDVGSTGLRDGAMLRRRGYGRGVECMEPRFPEEWIG
jgi:hypothetical protein